MIFSKKNKKNEEHCNQKMKNNLEEIYFGSRIWFYVERQCFLALDDAEQEMEEISDLLMNFKF
jgi:hypothetical protein